MDPTLASRELRELRKHISLLAEDPLSFTREMKTALYRLEGKPITQFRVREWCRQTINFKLRRIRKLEADLDFYRGRLN